MTDLQEIQRSDSLRNIVASFRMEGLTMSESTQSMILSVVRGERTLEECLAQIGAKYAGRSADAL